MTRLSAQVMVNPNRFVRTPKLASLVDTSGFHSTPDSLSVVVGLQPSSCKHLIGLSRVKGQYLPSCCCKTARAAFSARREISTLTPGSLLTLPLSPMDTPI